MRSHYSMLIQWSDENEAYIVSFPEFPSAHTHGASYEEAARNGQEALNLLLRSFEETHRSLPELASFEYAVA